jgi:hypothetical protein
VKKIKEIRLEALTMYGAKLTAKIAINGNFDNFNIAINYIIKDLLTQ